MRLYTVNKLIVQKNVWSIHSVRCSDDLFGMNLTELMVVDEFEQRSMTVTG